MKKLVYLFSLTVSVMGCGDDRKEATASSAKSAVPVSPSVEVEAWIWKSDPFLNCQEFYDEEIKRCESIQNSVTIIRNTQIGECVDQAKKWHANRLNQLGNKKQILETQYKKCLEVFGTQNMTNCEKLADPLLEEIEKTCRNNPFSK